MLLARGSLGNPWLFEQLLGRRSSGPSDEEVLEELDWVIDRAREHLGEERATRYLRKFYPWYIDQLSCAYLAQLGGASPLRAALQTAPSLESVRELLRGAGGVLAAAA